MIKLKRNKKTITFILCAVGAFFLALILGITPALVLFVATLAAYLKSQSELRKYNLLHISMLYVFIFTAAFLLRDHGLSMYYLPFSAVIMLAALLFNHLAPVLVLALGSSFTVGLIAGNNLNLALLFFISGVFSGMLILGSRRRERVIKAGLLTGLLQAAVLFLTESAFFHADLPFQLLRQEFIVLIINGVVSSFIVLGTLPVFEYLFQTVTNVSLLELADFQHPLLQRMVMEAPGTYHHSLVVGNLSEAACEAVGANALLARVGAYYHDIGKLQKPDYFSENQLLKDNKHDALSPTMSKLVIMNHIKEGMELARKYKINPRIINFIQQHHGKSLVYYFYRRALESLEDDNQVKEEGFRYPGPKPDSKETAIVLLADSTEAATRALKDPSPQAIEDLVHKIINNKFIDGQLDECELSLKDLERIAAVFIRILGGIYHSRVTYPEPKP